MNQLTKFVSEAIGLKTTCCRSQQFKHIERTTICTNPQCNNYLGSTVLKTGLDLFLHSKTSLISQH